MTTLYRQNRPDNFAICETFDIAAINDLIENPQCASLRIYYGMKDDNTAHAILVAADAEGNDLLPSSDNSSNAVSDIDEDIILEDSTRCPLICPPPSPLNT
jgi:hypothetical protein